VGWLQLFKQQRRYSDNEMKTKGTKDNTYQNVEVDEMRGSVEGSLQQENVDVDQTEGQDDGTECWY